MTIVKAAEQVFIEAKRRLSTKEIVTLIKAKNPESVLSKMLSKKPDKFLKTGLSTFQNNKWKCPRRYFKIDEASD